MGNVESFIEHIPIIGYIPAAVYAIEGDTAKAKRAAARCTHSTTQFVAVAGALALAPETGGLSLIGAGALGGAAGEAAGLGLDAAIETSYTEEELKELGGKREVLDMNTEQWITHIAIGAGTGAAMGGTRILANNIDVAGQGAVEGAVEGAGGEVAAAEEAAEEAAEGAAEGAGGEVELQPVAQEPDELVPPVEGAAEGAGGEVELQQVAQEPDELVPLRNNWAGPSPSVPVPPAGAGVKFLRGVKWFFTEAPIASRPYQIIINRGKKVELVMNLLVIAKTNVWVDQDRLGLMKSIEDYGVDEEDLKNRVEEDYDGRFMLFANSIVDKYSVPILQGGMHISTRAVHPSDARDSKSSYVYMTPSAEEHAIIYLEDSPSSSSKKGLIIRVSKSSGGTTSDRYLAVGDEATDKLGKNERRDSQSLYVYAHDDKKRAAVWEVSLFQKKHIVFRLLEAPTAGGTSFLSDATQDEKDYKAFYLTALKMYQSDSRPGGGVYMTVSREPKPIGFGLLIPHSDDLWWMDLQGDYDSFTIQQSLHHNGLLMMLKNSNDDSFYSLSPRQGSNKLDVSKKGKVFATLTASRDKNGLVKSVSMKVPILYLVIADGTVKASFDADIEGAKKYLAENYASNAQTPERMIVEVKNGVVTADPHHIGGQHQGGGVSAGFNKFWWNWYSIKAMNKVAETYLSRNKVTTTYLSLDDSPFRLKNDKLVVYLVVADGTVKASYGEIEGAKKYLAENYASNAQTPERMIVEVKNGVVTADPHHIGGQHQGGGVSTGFNKFWWNWYSIKAMNEVAKAYILNNDGMVPSLTYNRKWWFDVIGMYECHDYPNKNAFHYVNVEEDNGKLIWKNRAVQWQLKPSPDSSDTLITDGSPYPEDRLVSVEIDDFGEITGMKYKKDLYKRVFWHQYIGKYRLTGSDSKHLFADIVMGDKQNKLLMRFAGEEPMIALIPYDSEHFQVISIGANTNSSVKKLVKATRKDTAPTSYQDHATLTLPDGRKFERV